ncbi:hypothetical protein KAR91_87745 [Candidatus Pacearchaeota archaeon]|nr:hypothetical protein [Candidatus Pacearchaeota archaeon]
MPKITYIDKKFQPSSMAIIEQANDIIEEYQNAGYDLTLRQLYYQFVARDLIANKQSEYKRLGKIVSDGRLAGLIDWYAIEDRTRNRKGNQHWNDPGEIVKAAARGFMMDRWEGQDYHVEVWIEKEALLGIITSVCKKLDVSYFACKGFVSQSEMWSASQRLEAYKKPVIIHLGDHDPSGIDMTRDIGDRHEIFLGSHVEVRRIALNMDQVVLYSPPPNPTKMTDTRSPGYVQEHGDESWELDALEPKVMTDLIEDTVLEYRDEIKHQEVLDQEKEYLDILKNVEDNWQTL